jgi:hypothetical protein
MFVASLHVPDVEEIVPGETRSVIDSASSLSHSLGRERYTST